MSTQTEENHKASGLLWASQHLVVNPVDLKSQDVQVSVLVKMLQETSVEDIEGKVSARLIKKVLNFKKCSADEEIRELLATKKGFYGFYDTPYRLPSALKYFCCECYDPNCYSALMVDVAEYIFFMELYRGKAVYFQATVCDTYMEGDKIIKAMENYNIIEAQEL